MARWGFLSKGSGARPKQRKRKALRILRDDPSKIRKWGGKIRM